MKMICKKTIKKPNRTRSFWTEEQDKLLIKFVEVVVKTQTKLLWKQVEEKFKKTQYIRKADQCRTRYKKLMNDKQGNNKELSVDEQKELIELTSIYKNNWKIIGEKLNNRSCDFMKNQFYAIVNRVYRRLTKITFKIKSSTLTQLKPFEMTELFCITEEDSRLPITNELRRKCRKLILDHLEIELEDNLTSSEIQIVKEIGSILRSIKCQEKIIDIFDEDSSIDTRSITNGDQSAQYENQVEPTATFNSITSYFQSTRIEPEAITSWCQQQQQ